MTTTSDERDRDARRERQKVSGLATVASVLLIAALTIGVPTVVQGALLLAATVAVALGIAKFVRASR